MTGAFKPYCAAEGEELGGDFLSLATGWIDYGWQCAPPPSAMQRVAHGNCPLHDSLLPVGNELVIRGQNWATSNSPQIARLQFLVGECYASRAACQAPLIENCRWPITTPLSRYAAHIRPRRGGIANRCDCVVARPLKKCTTCCRTLPETAQPIALGRRIGQRRGATRAPPQVPRPECGPSFAARSRSFPVHSGIGHKAINLRGTIPRLVGQDVRTPRLIPKLTAVPSRDHGADRSCQHAATFSKIVPIPRSSAHGLASLAP